MKKIFLLSLILTLTGCATLFSGTSQVINVKVVNISDNQLLSDTTCSVREGNGALHSISSNPGTVSVRRGDGSLDIVCKKAGYKQLNTMISDSFNGTTFVNILFWPGFIVDGATGAYKKFPSHYVVNMEKTPEQK